MSDEPRRVALTFDDGPSEWTEPILDILQANDAKASFFVVGEHIAGREHIVRRIHEQGCEVCNHTWTHPNLEYLGVNETLGELAMCSQEICKTGVPAPYFYRAPFLRDTPIARAAGAAVGMVTVEYDVIGYDWDLTDPVQISANVIDGVDRENGGEIVLLHDGVPPDRDGNRQPTVDAVADLVPNLQSRGYLLVTVSELLGRAGVV